jgi:hypothetical protein
MRRVERRVIDLFRGYARRQGWRSDRYKIYFVSNEDWGYILVLLVAERFPHADYYDNYSDVHDYLEAQLKGKESVLLRAISLALRTFDQVKEGGMYAIPPSFEDADDIDRTRIDED